MYSIVPIKQLHGSSMFSSIPCILIKLCHPPDGWSSYKHNLLCFLNIHDFFQKEPNALAFNRDMCCYLALSLRLIIFHSANAQFIFSNFKKLQEAIYNVVGEKAFTRRALFLCTALYSTHGSTTWIQYVYFYSMSLNQALSFARWQYKSYVYAVVFFKQP